MIKQAQLDWSDGTPISQHFDDVYFSKVSGLEETQFVFLQHNRLAQRWQLLSQSHFTIIETGFGTGLNFLSSLQLWRQLADKNKTLHFVSVEKYPLSQSDLSQALSHWPSLKNEAQQLIELYPERVPGWHVIEFNQPNQASVKLHLFFGDIHQWLPQIQGRCDAWFLDGFAPSKNPDMWSEQLFLQMARLSHGQTSVATFTCAGLVKRGLKAAGFTIKKVKGFGKKREMLTAHFNQGYGPRAPEYLSDAPWYIPQATTSKGKHAIVVGAGIAGCSTAYSLAKRGWRVTLLDRRKDLAQGASGNAQGVLYAKLSSDMNKHSQFYLAGYLYSLRLLNQLLPDKKNWQDCGVLQLAMNEKEKHRQQQFCLQHHYQEVVEAVNAEQASQLAGTSLQQGGLFFKHGAWVSPKFWCEALTQDENITHHMHTQVMAIEQQKDFSWQVQCEQKSYSADALIMCNANDAKQLAPLAFLPTKPIAGQVTRTPVSTMQLNTVLCGEHYVAPAQHGQLNFGASYRLNDDNETVLEEDNLQNLANLASQFPSVFQQLQNKPAMSGRTSVRCTTPDYTPIVGPICQQAPFFQEFSNLQKSKKWRFYQAAPFYKNLYVNIGHGSRGLSSAPLSAEIIAAQMNGEILPLQKELIQILNPNRFLVNQLTQKKKPN